MTNTDTEQTPVVCQGREAEAGWRAWPARVSRLGNALTIERALPQKQLRLIGPWCFLDHIGPVMFGDGDKGVDVGPHPHIGLQTVTWLLEGELLHKDSLGYEQVIRPGQLNLMTAGHGISHSEESPPDRSARLHGVQFWIALPAAEADRAPAFEHYTEVPRQSLAVMDLHLVVGRHGEQTSPARVWSPLVGAELVAREAGEETLALEPDFEHGLMLLQGEASLDGTPMLPGTLYHASPGCSAVRLQVSADARVFLLGGEPLGEELLLWWNFVGRSTEEIRQARTDWAEQDYPDGRFGQVTAYDGARLPIPDLAADVRLK